MGTGAFGTCARIQRVSGIRVLNTTKSVSINLYQENIRLSFKRKNQTPQEELSFYGGRGAGGGKKQKGLYLEISSKSQAAWSFKHKNQSSFLMILGTKWPRPAHPTGQLSSMCWMYRGLGNKLKFTAVSIPRNWPYIERVQWILYETS